MNSIRYNQFLSVFFLAFGLLGFVPALLAVPSLSAPPLMIDLGSGMLFGFFAVNIVSNFAHMALGVWLWMASDDLSHANSADRVLSALMTVFTLLGLVPVLNTFFGAMPIYGHNVWLHALIAVVAGFYGFRVRPERHSTIRPRVV